MVKTKEKPKTGRLLLVAAVVAAAALAVAVAVSLYPRQEAPVPDGTVLVNDGANVVAIVPAEGVAVSALRAEDFAGSGDLIHYRGDAYRALQGIDVSEHQGAIDWPEAAASGVQFAFVRLGYRGSTEGKLYTDAAFEANLQGARDAGLMVGVYFFSQAVSAEEARQEAAYVLTALRGRALELPVMFDWEPVTAEGSRSAGVDGATLTDCAAAFCDEIAAGGYEAGLYLNRQQGYYTYDLTALTDRALWISDPNDWPDFYYAFRVWQYSFSGAVPGIVVPVDRDMLFLAQ